MQAAQPLRVVFKAALIFVSLNLGFAAWFPRIGYLSIFNRFIPGRLRFTVPQEPPGQYNKDALIFEDLDAMFASHVLSGKPKPEDEYRILFLGDSAVWGYDLNPGDVLSEQINKLDLYACDGRRVRAYDVAFPKPSFIRELLVLEKAVDYQPDLVIWPVSLLTFLSRRSDISFLRYHSDRVLDLIELYDLQVRGSPNLHPRTFWEQTLVGQRVRLKKVAIEQLYGLIWAGTGVDTLPPVPVPLPKDVLDPGYYDFGPPSNLGGLDAKMQFGALEAGYQIAGNIPVLVLNEPIFVATGANSEAHYNDYFSRWAYDEYRHRLIDLLDARDRDYLDLWDAIPQEEFIGSPLHLSVAGQRRLAILLESEILRLACQ